MASLLDDGEDYDDLDLLGLSDRSPRTLGSAKRRRVSDPASASTSAQEPSSSHKPKRIFSGDTEKEEARRTFEKDYGSFIRRHSYARSPVKQVHQTRSSPEPSHWIKEEEEENPNEFTLKPMYTEERPALEPEAPHIAGYSQHHSTLRPRSKQAKSSIPALAGKEGRAISRSSKQNRLSSQLTSSESAPRVGVARMSLLRAKPLQNRRLAPTRTARTLKPMVKSAAKSTNPYRKSRSIGKAIPIVRDEEEEDDEGEENEGQEEEGDGAGDGEGEGQEEHEENSDNHRGGALRGGEAHRSVMEMKAFPSAPIRQAADIAFVSSHKNPLPSPTASYTEAPSQLHHSSDTVLTDRGVQSVRQSVTSAGGEFGMSSSSSRPKKQSTSNSPDRLNQQSASFVFRDASSLSSSSHLVPGPQKRNLQHEQYQSQAGPTLIATTIEGEIGRGGDQHYREDLGDVVCQPSFSAGVGTGGAGTVRSHSSDHRLLPSMSSPKLADAGGNSYSSPRKITPLSAVNIASFLESLPLPLTHLFPFFELLGCTSHSDLKALSSSTETGRRTRYALLDMVALEVEDFISRMPESQHGPVINREREGLTRWERMVIEEGLKVFGEKLT